MKQRVHCKQCGWDVFYIYETESQFIFECAACHGLSNHPKPFTDKEFDTGGYHGMFVQDEDKYQGV